ncbi:MAG: ABC transporter permease [Verrucomicrobiota bacterium]
MNFRVIHALVLRYLYLYQRAPIRMVELAFWPFVQLLVWGYLTQYLQNNSQGDFPHTISFLIGAVILWDILFRAQQGVAIFFLEDVWTRNLLNIFAAPVRISDYLFATFVIGFLRAAFTVTLLCVLAATLYSFHVTSFNWYIVPFFGHLMIFGWALGMISTALILRWGPAAESLAWAVPFLIQPFAAVFYPVSELPQWLQWVAWTLPCSHIFEGMREVLKTGSLSGHHLLWATILNAFYLLAAGGLFAKVTKIAREKGLLTRFVSQ